MTTLRSRLAITGLVLVATMRTASADIYGYLDANDTLHLATEKLDERYTLFVKSGDGNLAAKVVRPDAAAPPDQALMKTRLFQRLVDHPNIAKYDAMIKAASAKHGLDPQLVKAVIAVESGFEPGAVSEKGAVGLMQVLPATGERYGVRADAKKSVDAKLVDPKTNLEIGTRYLADLRKMFVDRPELALAAYNAGENAVVRYRNTIPPYPETQAYVKLVDQFHTFYNPRRNAVGAKEALDRERLRILVPARRNLPDPGVPLRLPAPTVDTGSSASIAPPSPDADGAATSSR